MAPEPGAETRPAQQSRVATPEAREALKTPKASDQLVAQLALANFKKDAQPADIQQAVDAKKPREVHKDTFKALKAQHDAQREADREALFDRMQAEYDRSTAEQRQQGKFFDKNTATPAEIRDFEMAIWSTTEADHFTREIIEAVKLGGEDGIKEARDLVEVLNKLDFEIAGDSLANPKDIIESLQKGMYDLDSQQEGAFYKKFCKGDTNKALAEALTVEDMHTAEEFLTRLLGSKIAFDALVATKQAQERLRDASTPLSPTGSLNTGEDKILDFLAAAPVKKDDEVQLVNPHNQTPDNGQPDPTSSPSPDTTHQGPLTPEQQKVKDAEHEIFEMAGKRSAKEHMDLINEVVGDDTKGLKKEKKDGGNKLGKTIQETAAGPDGQRFIRDGAVAYIPSIPGEKVITIGDIHGDAATIRQLLNEEFIKNMESSNPTMRVVFLGDMVDRGPKSVEVMEIFMALKKRYGERIQMIAADHDTTANSVSSHDFPDKLKDKFGKLGADVYGSYDQLFKALPKMVVTGDGDVMVHGGFPPLKGADLQKVARLDGDLVYGESMSWGDPLDKAVSSQEQLAMKMREIAYASVMAWVDQTNLGDDSYVLLTNLQDQYLNLARITAANNGEQPPNPAALPNINENCSIKVKDLRKALEILQNLPPGVTLNMARAGSPYPIDAIVAGLFAYDENAFNGFMTNIGGKVMIRGHQTSNDVAGGPNMFGGRLQTIHSTGGSTRAGSPESYYRYRESDPKYVVLTLGQPRITLQAGRDVKDVWPTTPTIATQPAQPARPQAVQKLSEQQQQQQQQAVPAVKIIRSSGPLKTSPAQRLLTGAPKIYQPETIRSWSPVDGYRKTQRGKLERRVDGSILVTNPDGSITGYEKGNTLRLPSGRTINVFYDSRLSFDQYGTASYEAKSGGIRAGPHLINQLRTGKSSSRYQSTEDVLAHEYKHYEWDQLSEEKQRQVLRLFSNSRYSQQLEAFVAALITDKQYQAYSTENPSTPKFRIINPQDSKIYSIPVDSVVTEILSYAVTMPKSIGQVRSDLETLRQNPNLKINQLLQLEEKRLLRSLRAMECMQAIRLQDNAAYTALQQLGLIGRENFTKDYSAIQQSLLNLPTRKP